MKNKIDISIIIVSMNFKILERCIKSIIKYNKKLNYEIIIVAYIMKNEEIISLVNLINNKKINAKIIHNRKISGFSENQNIGLKIARGTYCLVLNDDTYFTDDSIERMYLKAKKYKIDIIAPVIYNPDQTIQISYRRSVNPITHVLNNLRVFRIDVKKIVSNKLYETKGISGSCFLIKKSTLESLGYFCERYFFTPEDIHLSRLAGKCGIKMYVDPESKVFHINSSSSANISDIITPVKKQGVYYYYRYFYGEWWEFVVRFFDFLLALVKFLLFVLCHNRKKMRENLNILVYSFIWIKPKDLFLRLLRRYEDFILG